MLAFNVLKFDAQTANIYEFRNQTKVVKKYKD